MEILGFRRKGPVLAYVVPFIMTIAVLLAGLLGKVVPLSIFGVIILGLFVWSVAEYCATPHEAIVKLDEHTILLKGKTVIPIREIKNVTFKRMQSRFFPYRWGRVIVSSSSGTYKINNIADCEEVASKLNLLAESHNSKTRRPQFQNRFEPMAAS